MKFKLIATDMDGTLLNSNKEVSQRNKEILHKAKESGVQIVIATGRIYTSARMYARLLGINTPIIACNGAIIRASSTEEIIESTPIENTIIKEILEALEESNIYYHFYGSESFYTKELKYTSDYYYKLNNNLSTAERINIKIEENPLLAFKSREIKDDILKFVVIDEDISKLNFVRDKLRDIQGVSIDKSWYNNIEIMAKGVSKGNALKKLRKLMEISKEEIISFGDNENDISLFEESGFKVAMANGEEILKEKADYITLSNDEDGVAYGIDKFVISE